MDPKQVKIAYVITDRGDKSYWTRIGVAYVNRDGSLNIKLDAVPISGTIHVRDPMPRDESGAQAGLNGKRMPGGHPSETPLPDDVPGALS